MKFGVMLLFLLGAGLTLASGAADVRYRVVAVEPPQPNPDYWSTVGYTINDNGLVAGMILRHEAPYPSGSTKGVFVHTDESGFQEIGEYQGAFSQPNRINNRGQFTVVGGRGYETNGTSFYVEHAVRYTPGIGFEQLGDLGGNNTRAYGINSHGDVVGRANTTLNTSTNHAFLYTDARGFVDLGTFGGISAAAGDINDDGWICGYSVFPGVGLTAFIYHEDEGVTFLGDGAAIRINEQRVVVQNGYDLYAVLVFPDGRSVPMQNSAEVTYDWFIGDLNDWNVVVDTALRPVVRLSIGAIWTEGEGMRDLNRLIETNSGWFITYALDINNHGQISGVGSREGSRSGAVRLDPIPPKPSIACQGENVVVSWTPAWPGITVESSASIGSPNWSQIPHSGTNHVTIPMTENARFFRLNLDALRGMCCIPEPPDVAASETPLTVGLDGFR